MQVPLGVEVIRERSQTFWFSVLSHMRLGAGKFSLPSLLESVPARLLPELSCGLWNPAFISAQDPSISSDSLMAIMDCPPMYPYNRGYKYCLFAASSLLSTQSTSRYQPSICLDYTSYPLLFSSPSLIPCEVDGIMILRWENYLELSIWGQYNQLCPILWVHIYCTPPGSSAHGIFHARILEWVAIS